MPNDLPPWEIVYQQARRRESGPAQKNADARVCAEDAQQPVPPRNVTLPVSGACLALVLTGGLIFWPRGSVVEADQRTRREEVGSGNAGQTVKAVESRKEAEAERGSYEPSRQEAK